jgi:hypothetical protein
MKLRISGNNLRVRLSQAETAQLAAGESLEQFTHFSLLSRLVARVEVSGTRVSAEFSDGQLTLRLPAITVRRWADSEEVAIDAEQDAGSNRVLKILIEKDFQCLHSQTPPEVDAFPNPAAR